MNIFFISKTKQNHIVHQDNRMVRLLWQKQIYAPTAAHTVMQQFKVEKLPHQQEYRINGEQKQLMHFPSYSVSNAHDSSNEK